MKLIICFLSILLLLSLCSNNTLTIHNKTPFTNIKISFNFLEETNLSKIEAIDFDTVFLKVTGQGMNQYNDTLVFDDENQIVSILEIPAGNERLFKATSKEIYSEEIYAGSTYVDLVEGTEVDIEIDLGIIPDPPELP